MAAFTSNVRRARYKCAGLKWPVQIVAALVVVAVTFRLLWLDGTTKSQNVVQTKQSKQIPNSPISTSGAVAQQPAIKAPTFASNIKDPSIKWDKYAYVLQAASPEYLCNALMIFSELKELGSKAARVLQYPKNWQTNPVNEHGEPADLATTAKLLQLATETYNVKLELVDSLHKDERHASWTDTFNRLSAFNMTEYDRVVTLDTDSIVLRNLDELFFIQAAPLAMPYIYTGEPASWRLSNHLMVITPANLDYFTISTTFAEAPSDSSDMDVLAGIYSDKIVRLPQRPYNLLTEEFHRSDHKHYLSAAETWDATRIFGEAKFVHFEDHPLPKPWMKADPVLLEAMMPQCEKQGWFGEECTNKQVWKGLYDLFTMKRAVVCGAGLSAPPRVVETPVQQKVVRGGKWPDVNVT